MILNNLMSITPILLLLFTAIAAAADTVYSVILNSPNTDTGVIINNQVYTLQPSTKSSILYQGNAPSNAPYSYAKLKKGTTNIIERENFARPAITTNTVNEFYNRNWNTKEVSTFETISTITKNFNRRPDNSLLHPIGEIPTIHVIAQQSDLDNIHKNYLQDITIKANVTYISTKSVQTFSDVKFEIGGRSSRLFTKFAYNIKLPKKGDQNLGGYKKLKLRTTVSDPSYMREYLATEILYAANQPSSRASYVRVFLNDRAVGLYSLLEKYDDTWLANEFGPYSDTANYANGILYEGEGGKKDETRADLSYKGKDPSSYNSSAYSISEKSAQGVATDYTDLIAFTKFIHDQLEYQKSNNATMISYTTTEWEKQIDVEGFLVNMAFEFIHGFWDGYLHNTDNYFLYKSPEQNRFIWISWDFDYVMGSGPVNMKAISVGDYNNYGGVQSRPLMVALLNVPEYRSLFEKHLQSIINTLYNPVKSFPVIDSVVNLIQDDVAWDKTLPHVREGLEYLTLSSLQSLFNSNSKGDNAGKPISISYITAAEFLLRINADVSFSKAINGNTGHVSLYGVKEWIKLKLDNIQKKTTYKPLLPFLHLKN